jgi:hypothetical protein
MNKLSVLVVGLVFMAHTAQAQFVGGAAPAGAPYQVFAVPGAAAGGGLATIFTCTNASDTTLNVAVQLFDQNGCARNNASAEG